MKGGAKYPKFLYAWDAGFDAYTCLIANRPWASEQPGRASAPSWPRTSGAGRTTSRAIPAPAHALMKQVNPNMTDDFLAFSRKMIVDEKLVIGRHATDDSQTGRISRERYANQIQPARGSRDPPQGKAFRRPGDDHRIPPMRHPLGFLSAAAALAPGGMRPPRAFPRGRPARASLRARSSSARRCRSRPTP